MHTLDVNSIARALMRASTTLDVIHGGDDVLTQGVDFGSLHGDTELRADKVLGEVLLKEFEDENTRVTVEGLQEWSADAPAKYWVTVDPLDGSLNYQRRGRTKGWPYTGVVTALRNVPGVKFSDIECAGIIDYRTRDIWVADAQRAYFAPAASSFLPVSTDQSLTLDLRIGIVVAELYYPSNRRKAVEIFDEEKGWLRSPGSAAYEMASVVTGQALAFICDQQKQHELGAAYLLIKKAGGVAVDWSGTDLGNREYLFNAQTPIVLAANQRIADAILERIQKLGLN